MELHLTYSTIFEPMGRNEVNALPLFSQWIQQGRLDRWTNLVRQIIRERIRAEAALDFVWDSLPHAACQGDLSLGNLGLSLIHIFLIGPSGCGKTTTLNLLRLIG